MRMYIEEACEQIDAAMFSGDAFEDVEERKRLREYIGRWTRGLTAISDAIVLDEGSG